MEIASRTLDDINPQGRFAHLPESEPVGVDGTERTFLLLLDLFPQFTHRRTFSDDDVERVVGHIENPTEHCKLII